MDESSSERTDSDESPRDQSTILDDIAELADRKEGFDVFQVAAFWVGAVGCREISKWLLLKCWLAVALQVLGTSFLIYDYSSSEVSTLHLSHTKCKDDDVDICYLILVGLIGVFASIYMHQKFYFLADSGMYSVNMRTLENLPECISGPTLLCGRIYNMFLYAGLCIANMYMLFKTHHVANMFLNCVALEFVVDIDNNLVSSQDYEQIAEYIRENKQTLETPEKELATQSTASARFSIVVEDWLPSYTGTIVNTLPTAAVAQIPLPLNECIADDSGADADSEMAIRRRHRLYFCAMFFTCVEYSFQLLIWVICVPAVVCLLVGMFFFIRFLCVYARLSLCAPSLPLYSFMQRALYVLT